MNRTHAISILALAILASVGTEARAQSNLTGDPMLYACYVKNTGTVYRIKTTNAPTKCSTNHTEFSWNAEGQPGPQGPVGPAGPSGFQAITTRELMLSLPYGGQLSTWVQCQANEVVIGGGYFILGDPPAYRVLASAPSYNDVSKTHSWHLNIQSTVAPSAPSNGVKGYAICMTVPSEP